MANTILTMEQGIITALLSAADRYNADPVSRKINMGLVDHVCFLLTEGAGGTGTVKIQVFVYDEDGLNGEAIDFKYRVTAAGELEAFGAVTDATAAAGYTTVAGASKQVAIEVQGRGSTPAGKPFVGIVLTEVVNSPCNAGILAICARPRYGLTVAPPTLSIA